MYSKLLLSLSILSILTWSNLHAEDSIDADLGGFDTEEIIEESADDLAGFGDEDSELDGFGDEGSDLDGFGDEEIATSEIVEIQKEERSNLTFSGDLAFKTSAGFHSHEVDGIDYSGINQAQTSLYLQLDYKISDNWKMRVGVDTFYDGIYDLYSSNNYNDDVLDTYRTQLMLTDAYFQGRVTNDIDLKIGHQIVVWGKSDSIRITDVINPLDNRLPGMTDIEDLRLSVAMIKADYYVGQWNFSAMAIVESRIMLEAAPRGEFFPVDAVFPLGAPNPFIELVTPDSSFENMQYAFAANGVFSGWDLSFYAADVLDSKWHIDPIAQKRIVSKVGMIGSAINIATGSWLLKSEMAFLSGVKYNSTTDAKNRLDALVGVDYMGIKDTVLSLELANRHIFDYESQMNEFVTRPDYVDRNEIQTAMRMTNSFANDSINTTLLLSMFGSSWEYGGFFRGSVAYDVMDAVVANFGVVDYIGGDKPFVDAIKDNDRIFADITYSF